MEPIDHESLKPQVMVMQIITMAMAMGVLTFGVIVTFIANPPAPADGDAAEVVQSDPLIAYLGIGVAATCLVISVVGPRIVASKSPATVGTYQTTLIIALALLEGGAFFNLIAYLLHGRAFSLATAGLLVVFLLMQFPTTGRVSDWLQERARRDREAEMFNR